MAGLESPKLDRPGRGIISACMEWGWGLTSIAIFAILWIIIGAAGWQFIQWLY
jgi:hypothetical protein